jgi:hypothetical protein
VRPGAALDVEFTDGHIDAHADPRGLKPRQQKRRRRTDDNQGSLL